MLVLTKARDRYGYELVHQISMKFAIAEGTIYPILRQHLTLEITVQQQLYQALKVNANTGEINVENIHADNVTVAADTGAITVGNVSGSVYVQSDTGAIHIHSVKGDVQVRADTGLVEIQDTNGAVDVHNNTGAVTVSVPSITHNITVRDDTGSGAGGPMVEVDVDTGPITLQTP